MKTLTSLEAQSRFGEMIDASQREPVIITRRGRPVSIVMAVPDRNSMALLDFMRAVRALAPLDGSAAVEEFDRIARPVEKRTKAAGLRQADIDRILDGTK